MTVRQYGTQEWLKELRDPQVQVIFQPCNWGKGAALRTGFAQATGDIVLQDADLEYDPRDYAVLLGPILDGDADVVFGSRFLGGPHRVSYYWHSIANSLLTHLSNMLTNLNLTDMELGYKVFTRDALSGIVIESDRFGFEPEIAAKVALRGLRVYEVPVRYRGRTYAEGKKIGFRDALEAVWVIARFGLLASGARASIGIGAARGPALRSAPQALSSLGLLGTQDATACRRATRKRCAGV